ncbi:beta-L-arabinofuranosidase domain-containing protein [Pedobacter sp. Du54]|uniref:beta-L-arabinofuranosidase domain-containing protein n=1 Tax=Pedobacter anseongensis TaxID=3133439 RepID=UPI0030957B76
MKMVNLFLRVLVLLAILFESISSVKAQNGDQILDGIGETEMVARYVFNGDLKDWSRNNFHAKFQGAEVKFFTDNKFGKVLSLSGASDDYISIPKEVLNGIESLSITGWIYLRSTKRGQHFFDFGKNANAHFFYSPAGTIKANSWVHITKVIDISSKSLTTYIDGKLLYEPEDIPLGFFNLFKGQSDGNNIFYIGKSMQPVDPNLNAMLYDFRIYRVPLSSAQVAGIYANSQKGNQQSAVNVGRREANLPQFSKEDPQLYTAYLSRVADVEVETTVGSLPRLPGYIEGTYQNEIKGPQVRVLWPSPVNNANVLKPGKYTVTGRITGTDFEPKAYITVKESTKLTTPALKLAVFDLDKVSLTNDVHNHQTKFIENRDKFINTLATTDPNSFLYMFRQAFGQKQPDGAKPLGGWDTQDTKLRGHATGHYLSAIAQAYAGTGYDKRLQSNFSQKMEYMVNTLYELSKLSRNSDPTAVPYGSGKSAYDSDFTETGIRKDYWNWGKGFISAYPPDQFIMLENGAKYGGQKNSIWAPYYTLHKILSGLLDVYEVSGNKKALEVAAGMGNWVYARLSKLPQETLIKMWNTYIAGEFGGMNETMARLYRITNNQNYLKTAQLFDNIKVFYGDTAHSHGLAKNVDLFRGLHANQHIPQIVGSIEMYRVSNNPEYYKIADNFWYKMVNDYMYSIGGVAGARNPANAECFISEPGTLYENGFSAGGQNETCATYNMLKLTSDLFLFDQRAELMDYYERGLYNHILASVAENSPANTYHVPLGPGSVKQFGNAAMTGFTCCNGTALESSTKLQNSIYFKSKDNQALYVNLYIPSTLEWTERKVRIEQTTDFPKEDHTKLTIKGSGKFDINVRVPGWATKGFIVKINGEVQKLQSKPGSYLKISRTWKAGDTIELKMPFQFHLDPVMDQQNIASLFYGPIVLAAQEPEARKDWRKVTLDAKDISKSIKGDPAHLQFTIDDVIFKPFYDTYGRHSVYLDVELK